MGGVFALGEAQLGDVLVFVAILLSALSYLPAQRVSQAVGPVETSFVCQAASVPLLLPLLLIPLCVVTRIEHSHLSQGIGYLLISVFIFNILANILWYYSLHGIRAWIAAALRCVGPVVAAPIAWLFFNQTLSVLQICGALVVLVTSVLMVRARERVEAA